MPFASFLWKTSLLLDRAGVPALRLWPGVNFSVDALTAQVTAILRGWGMPEEQVAVTVPHLLYADFHGIDSHGVGMLLDYHQRQVAGRLNLKADVRVLRQSATTALVDGGGGMGHFPADLAMKLAIEKCQQSGLGAVCVRNSGHYGAAGTYAAMATRAGFIGLTTTNNRAPAVVPTFGVQAMLGTNPIALAAPAKRNRPFLLDMATSTAAVGKVMNAWRKGQPIPEGWAIDPKGNPCTNPRRAAKYRRLTPLGSTREMSSHKGYGLAAAVEILSAILSGLRSAGANDGPNRVGHFFLCIDPKQFGEPGAFEADLDNFMDGLRASDPVDPEQPVMVAGDPEYAALERTARQGVHVSRAVLEDLRLICAQSNVPFTLNPAEQGVLAV